MVREFKKDIERNLENLDFKKEFGAEIAKADLALTLANARRDSQVTQAEMANKLSTTQSYIAKLEGGEANPTIGTIGKAFAVLGLRLSTSAIPLMPVGYTFHELHLVTRSDKQEELLDFLAPPIISFDTKNVDNKELAVGV